MKPCPAGPDNASKRGEFYPARPTEGHAGVISQDRPISVSGSTVPACIRQAARLSRAVPRAARLGAGDQPRDLMIVSISSPSAKSLIVTRLNVVPARPML